MSSVPIPCPQAGNRATIARPYRCRSHKCRPLTNIAKKGVAMSEPMQRVPEREWFERGHVEGTLWVESLRSRDPQRLARIVFDARSQRGGTTSAGFTTAG